MNVKRTKFEDSTSEGKISLPQINVASAAKISDTNTIRDHHGSPSNFLKCLEHEVEDKIRAIKVDTNNPIHAANLKNSEIQAGFFSISADACQSEYQSAGNLDSLEKSIECQRRALSLIEEGHDMELQLLDTLGSSLYNRFQRLGQVADVNEAIEYFEKVVKLTPEDDTSRLDCLSNLGLSWWARFEKFSEQAALDKTIEFQKQVVQFAPEDHPNKPGFLSNLGSSWICRFELLSNLADLNEAITCQTRAVKLAPNDYVHKSALLINLGQSMLHRSEQLCDLTDLDKAIECGTQAIQLLPENHIHRPNCLSYLGKSRVRRFELGGDLKDLDKAIECQEQAVQLIPEGHRHKANYLNNVGYSRLRRFREAGDLKDLDKAIEYREQAVQLVSTSDEFKMSLLKILGYSRLRRFDQAGALEDVDKTIEYQTQMIQLAPPGSPSDPNLLYDLAQSRLRRFERVGDLEDLDKAIESQTQAIQLTPKEHTSQLSFLSFLGSLQTCRFQRMGDLEDVNKAIESQEQALQLAPENHADKSVLLDTLGCSRLRRFEHTGELEDVDKAIEYQMQAIQLTTEGHVSKPGFLSNLGHSFRRRFERLNDPEDLEVAIQYGEQAVSLSLEGHTDKHVALMCIGCSWSSRFERLEQPGDIDKAIECQRRAVQLIPNSHVNKQMYLNGLGHSWARRFAVFGQLADLDNAIQCNEQAVRLTHEHPDRPRNLNNLGNSFMHRYKISTKIVDLDKGAEYLAEAIRLTPDGHRWKPHQLLNLGHAQAERFEVLGQRADLESAQAYFRHGAEHIIIDPGVQIRCARGWVACSTRLGLSPLEAYQRSFALIPHYVWMGLTIQHRYSVLTTINDFVAEAARWAVHAEHYDLAVEWLEEGRSIVWNQILHLRTPFDTLNISNSELANRLKGVACELEGAGSRMHMATTISIADLESRHEPEHRASQHRRLAAQWEDLLAEVCQLPGFRDFLRPQKFQELKKAAKRGPIVIINTHTRRCDALIIFPGHDDIVHVPLDSFSEAKAVECRAQMVSMIGHRGDCGKARGVKPFSKNASASPQDQLRPLAVLWSDVVGPVLNVLAIARERPYHELPHITWCATGALSFLPLHAAGLYNGTSLNAFDLIISSYTPTLSALLAHSNYADGSNAGVLAVGQANSPGLPPLPKIVEELAIIKNHASATPFEQLDGPLATVEATLNAMENHSWVHLACHATQNRADPSQSAFHLHDGKLTLATITKRAFKNKGLAFLSACQTATRDDELPDEATHLAAGMHMAGYPSVIATMWSIKDEDAPEVAEEVYAESIQDGKMDHTNAAMALHKAVGKLREKVGLESIGRWAPFVYMGV